VHHALWLLQIHRENQLRRTYAAFLAVLFLLLSGCSTSRDTTQILTGQHPYAFSREIKKIVSANYLLYLPDGYGKEDKQWPLVLFLHGSGERGADLNRVKVHGPPKLVENGKKFDFIVVSPQCPRDEEWSEDVLGALLDEVEGRYAVDRSRIYVTGLSMGGYGTWRLGMAFPDRFAALVPICGGGSAVKVCSLKDIPIRVYHGKKDKSVPLEEAQKLVERLKACGGNVELIVYPDAGHDSWTETYNNTGLYEWMLKQSLKK